MIVVEFEAAPPAKDLEACGTIIAGIVRDCRGMDAIGEPPLPQELLRAAEFGNRQGTFQGILAAGIKENHDRRMAAEELVERYSPAGMIFEDDRLIRAVGPVRPGKDAPQSFR